MRGREKDVVDMLNLVGFMGKPKANQTPEMLIMWTKSTPEATEIMCVRFSPNADVLAAGCGDGAIRVSLHAGKDESYWVVRRDVVRLLRRHTVTE